MQYKGKTINDAQELRATIIFKQLKKQKVLKVIKIITLILLELIGIATIFFSITTFGGYSDSFPTFMRPEYEYYGGDAYTDIQNATADVAENVAESGDLLKNLIYDFSYTIGGVLLIAGLLILLLSTYYLIKTFATPIVVDKNIIDSLIEKELLLGSLEQ